MIKHFILSIFVFCLVGAGFIVGDYMGAKAQKDADRLHAADLSNALVKAVAQFNACEASDITPVISHASGTLTLSAIQKPKRHHRKPATKTCFELKPYVDGQLSGMGVRNWVAPEHPYSLNCPYTAEGGYNVCAPNWIAR
jgi:hypothetical protein